MPNVGDMKEALDRIEAEISEVKRQYDLFFQGIRRQEPSEKRREVEETVRRFGQRRIINTFDQFRFNALQSKFYSLVNLWVRTVRDIEGGRLTRDPSGALVRTPPPPMDPVDPGHLDQVIDRLAGARKECGLPAEEADLAAIRETLLVRAREIAGKSGASKVEFRVSVE
ncbi:MAG: hypothetical protein HZA60_11155, partial [Deltaproteobacteria bacterium]|nr:hypothetical protein [Deltaproteobacteria bacterium]